MRSFGLLLLLTASPALASEYALFTGGGRQRVDRHEVRGAFVRLYIGAGYSEFPVGNITGFEAAEDAVAETKPAPQPAPASVRTIAPPPTVLDASMTPLELADAAAVKYGLPRALVRSVMATESSYQKRAKSKKGAIGLMQLMPGTAQILGANPHDPVQNVDAGVRYLRDLLVKYNGGLWRALAAYNAGPGAVDKYNWVPPYRETVDYVNRVDAMRKRLEKELEPYAEIKEATISDN